MAGCEISSIQLLLFIYLFIYIITCLTTDYSHKKRLRTNPDVDLDPKGMRQMWPWRGGLRDDPKRNARAGPDSKWHRRSSGWHRIASLYGVVTVYVRRRGKPYSTHGVERMFVINRVQRWAQRRRVPVSRRAYLLAEIRHGCKLFWKVWPKKKHQSRHWIRSLYFWNYHDLLMGNSKFRVFFGLYLPWHWDMGGGGKPHLTSVFKFKLVSKQSSCFLSTKHHEYALPLLPTPQGTLMD